MTDELTELPTRLNSLPEDARQEKREKLTARRVFAKAFGPFVKAMRECMTAYHDARQQGMDRADAAKGIEHVLREMWPKAPSKFQPQCLICDDLGLEELLCRPYARCQREICQRKGEDWQHLYVGPCGCPKGDKFRPKVYQPAEQAASVGKVSKRKPGSWSRMGV
jgi:hypothetical protein